MLGFKNTVDKESAHAEYADDNLNFTTNLLEFKGSIRYRKTRSSTWCKDFFRYQISLILKTDMSCSTNRKIQKLKNIFSTGTILESMENQPVFCTFHITESTENEEEDQKTQVGTLKLNSVENFMIFNSEKKHRSGFFCLESKLFAQSEIRYWYGSSVTKLPNMAGSCAQVFSCE